MKRITAAVFAVLLLASCSSPDKANDTVGYGQDDPIYSDCAEFNALNGAESGTQNEDTDSVSNSTEKSVEYSVSDAFKKYSAALSSAKSLKSYAVSADKTVSVEVDKTTVDLEKSTVEASLDKNSDFIYKKSVSLKDKHNRSVSLLTETVYGDKSAGKSYARTQFSDVAGTTGDYIETKKLSYKFDVLEKSLGSVYALKSSNIESVSCTESESGTTFKFMVKTSSANQMVKNELNGTDFDAKVSNISVSYFILTAHINSDGVLYSANISARCRADDSDGSAVYSVGRSIELSDINSGEILCEVPDWAR